MKSKHSKYKIKQGDTLQSITRLFGVEEDVWTRYHNNMCRLDDVITDVLPEHLEEIYLLPELWEKENSLNFISPNIIAEKDRPKIQLGYQNTLYIKPFTDVLHYGVSIKIFNNQKINTIRYPLSIKCMGREGKNFQIEINKAQEIYINDNYADLIADELAVKVSAVLYPLVLTINNQNDIIGISNFHDIQKRWEGTKESIRNYSEGITLEKYLHLNDIVLKSEKTLLNSLSNDWFLHAYFNKIYNTYCQEFSLNNKLYAPFIFDRKGVEYNVKQVIEKQSDEKGFIVIQMEGEMSDKRSVLDMEQKLDIPTYQASEYPSGVYNAGYKINADNHTIEQVNLECSLELSVNRKVFVTITRIK